MDEESLQWDAIYRSSGRVFLEPALVVVEMAEVLRERSCGRVLDLGCGNGRHMVYLAQQGFHVCGLDNSPTALRLAQRWLREEDLPAPLVLGDMRQALPFRDGAFDALVSTQVIHHARLATVRATAWEIARILAEGGVLLVTVPVGKHPNQEYIEIEPGTFVPTSGSEKGLPHHIFAPDEVPALFPDFTVLELSVRGEVVTALLAVKDEPESFQTRSG